MKKTIIYLTILVIIAVCSFAGGYIGSLKANIKDNNENTTQKEQILEQSSEQTPSQSQTTELSDTKTPSKSSSKNTQQKKSTSSTSSKEEKRIVYLDVYHRNDCGFCNNLLNFLNNLDSSTKSQMVIRKHDVTKEYDNFQTAVKKYGNNEGYGVPYVVFNNEKALTGYSKDLENKYKTYINDYIK